MKRNDNILNELDAIGSEYLYAFIQCPFVVNDAYFLHLPHQLMGDIKLITNFSEPVLSVPTDTVLNPSIPWQVPTGYFENFASLILTKLRTKADDKSDIYNVIPQTTSPFLVKEDYFEQNIDQLLIQVGATEPAELSPMLEGLRTKMPFETPNGYFESTNLLMPNQEIPNDKSLNIIDFKPKSKKKNTKTWLVAASVLLMVSFGVNRFLDVETEEISPDQKINTLLASISDRSIDEYIDYNLDEFELTSMNNTITTQNQLLNAISNSEIDAYLELMN